VSLDERKIDFELADQPSNGKSNSQGNYKKRSSKNTRTKAKNSGKKPKSKAASGTKNKSHKR
jgi:hypothetical protein